MLVLTRKLQEKIQIGDNITVTILRVKGRSVRVGIEAPKGVRVMRSEIPAGEFEKEDEAGVEGEMETMELTLPPVAEASMCLEDDDQHEASEMPTEAPLSLHIARRFRIITPNVNSKLEKRTKAALVAKAIAAH